MNSLNKLQSAILYSDMNRLGEPKCETEFNQQTGTEDGKKERNEKKKKKKREEEIVLPHTHSLTPYIIHPH